jgi:dipeptidyl aminopeptidase/acylaminoacyl peptidase
MRNKTKVLMCLRGGSNDFGAIKTGFFFNKQTYFSWFSLSTYITITTQHRGTSGCTGTDEFGGKDLDDIRYLYKILQKLPFCDTEHIGIFGWSRGAQMVYQLLKTERWIKSAVCIAGPTDHIRMVRDAFRPEWKKHLEKLYGGSISETKKRSALYWAYKMNPVPLLIMHGTSDDRANVQDSIDLHALLPHSTLRLFKGDDHSLTHNFNKARLATMKWFNATL